MYLRHYKRTFILRKVYGTGIKYKFIRYVEILLDLIVQAFR